MEEPPATNVGGQLGGIESGYLEVVTSWGKKSELHVPYRSDDNSFASRTTNHNASLTVPTSDAGGSSDQEINDFGDAKQLQQRRDVGRPTPNDNKGQLVSHTGPSYPPKLPATGSDLSTLVGNSQQSGKDDDLDANEDLGGVIRSAFENGNIKTDTEFLPFDKLDLIITPQTAYEELRLHPLGKPDEELERLAHQICDEKAIKTPGSKAAKLTSRRKIFAILVLINEVALIVKFIAEGLWDSFLPFHFAAIHNGRGTVYSKFKRVDNQADEEYAIHCFENTKTIFRENFQKYQWKLLSPYFKVISRDNSMPLHYPLDDQVTLPFIEDQEKETTQHRYSGGYGEVWRVRIHKAHYNQSSENECFAIKRLHRSNEDEFKREASALKRLTRHGQHHPHLIRLQLTYLYRGGYHFVFPWADGNLRAYWERFPDAGDHRRDHQYVTWMAAQWLGISEGLQAIHDCPQDADYAEGDGIAKEKTRGRHGDIKPENILWFAPRQASADQQCEGTLVISDFGLTQFNRVESQSRVSPNMAISRTYRPPEYDVCTEISQRFDIWTLGCVMLEFLVWYLQGATEWDDFSKKRRDDDLQNIPEDVYFSIVHIRWQRLKGARIKRAVVQKCEDLSRHHRMTPFLADMLELIETRLLRMRPEVRAQCDEVVANLKTLHDRCLTDKGYCTDPVPSKPRRADTALSELVATPYIYSEPMDSRLEEMNANPPIHRGKVDGKVVRAVHFEDGKDSPVSSHNEDADGTQYGSPVNHMIFNEHHWSESPAENDVPSRHESPSPDRQERAVGARVPPKPPQNPQMPDIGAMENERVDSHGRRRNWLRRVFCCPS